MPNYTFTPEALNDLQDIVEYTIKEWGKSQARIYVENLQLITSRLADTPTLGRHRSNLRKDLRSFPYASHSLFYTETLKGIIIIRVLHKKMDIAQQL